MKFTIDTSHAADVEQGIAPPMRTAVTIPIVAEMGARGAEVVLYVATAAFGQPGVPTSDRELRAIAQAIIVRLMGERCEHDWQEQPGEPPVDVCSSCGAVRR